MFGLGPGLDRLPRGGMRDYGGGGGDGRGRSRQPWALILALRLVHQISQLRHKPPLTLALMAGMSALHLKPDIFEDLFYSKGVFEWSWLTGGFDHIRNVCLLPASILDTYERTGELEIRRLLVSPFVHGDDMHLYYNMASFLLKGVSLELTMGTQAFAGLLSFSLLASQTLMMLSAWVLLVVFDVPSPMHACTVGFSGVLFALKYVLSRRSPGVTTVMGYSVHTRYAAWLELVLISVMVPNASFLGHLCGILAGVLYVEVPIVLRVVNLFTGISIYNNSRGPSYTYNSGTSGRASPEGARTETRQQSPNPPAAYDIDSDAEAEEAALQEALRRSLLESTAGGGANHNLRRDNAGSVTDNPGSRSRPIENDAVAATEFLGPSPTAPPPEEDAGGYGAGGGQIAPDELRRRRLRRLGAGT
ncbi:unnamed protein product [Ectocarpus sp. CCAP 1310/34]|nr:unnamed protein product [Ectocarpus sp. CCAP 1310/34]